MEQNQTKFPTETINLPSQGKFYDDDNPLKHGKIEIKYMTAKEEDILTSKNLIQKGIVLDKLLQSLIVTPINFDDLLIGDKNAILFASRILAYGKDYNIELDCPTCGKKSQYVIDLSKIEHKQIDFSKYNKQASDIEFVLPSSKIKLTIKLLRSKDEKSIDDTLKGLKKVSSQSGVDHEMTTRLKHIITSVNGNRDISVINKFVDEALLSRDSLELRTFIREITPDIDSNFDFICNLCSDERNIPIPLDTEFFWPRGSR